MSRAAPRREPPMKKRSEPKFKVGACVSIDRFCAANKPIGVITKLYTRGTDRLARVRWNVAMDLYVSALVPAREQGPRHRRKR